jgi:hypothetical protein
MNIFRLFSPDTTTSWVQSSSASCTGWFCRATATTVIAPTTADQIASMMTLMLAACIVVIMVTFVGLIVGWWGRGEEL